ncbi:hypothetical protein CBL_10953 [Carabus blaptoides fortunei]
MFVSVGGEEVKAEAKGRPVCASEERPGKTDRRLRVWPSVTPSRGRLTRTYMWTISTELTNEFNETCGHISVDTVPRVQSLTAGGQYRAIIGQSSGRQRRASDGQNGAQHSKTMVGQSRWNVPGIPELSVRVQAERGRLLSSPE